MNANPILKPNDRVTIPMMHHPLFRVEYAVQNGVEKNILFRTWGGIGDQICAEPTLRYALKMFKGCTISLASTNPELFSHLKFDAVFDLRKKKPDYGEYLLFDTITPPDDSNMVWLFFSHLLTNCVDFPSLCALRQQLPVEDREIKLSSTTPKFSHEMDLWARDGVAIHPGKHWQSKTFPKDFWDRVIIGLKNRGLTPLIIGANADDNRGTVDVDTAGCIDLRNRLSITESIWLLHRTAVLLTNDSAPMHMAASGNSYIGFVATCKHPDMITHWRKGQWQWRERNFGKGGIWDTVDYCPNKAEKVEVEFVEPKLLESWLPNPYEMADWAYEMRKSKMYQDSISP